MKTGINWPDPYVNCYNTQDSSLCYESLRLKPSDVPADATLIAVANEFLDDHKIDYSNYGDPQVDNQWKENQESDIYIPETISIVYPELIDGKIVLNNSGYPEGIRVNVNIRHERVSGLWGLRINQYLKSMYPAASGDTILKDAGKGGWESSYSPANAKLVNVKIENPEMVYLKYYHYNEAEERYTEEIFMPAYNFSIAEKTGALFLPKSCCGSDCEWTR